MRDEKNINNERKIYLARDATASLDIIILNSNLKQVIINGFTKISCFSSIESSNFSLVPLCCYLYLQFAFQ